MPELERQLRVYYDATTRTVDVDAVLRSERPVLRIIATDDPHGVGAPPPVDLSTRRPRTALLAVAAAVAVVALGAGLFIAGTRVGRTPQPAARPPSVATTTPTIEDDGTVVPAEELGIATRQLEPGRYRTDLLGVDLAFDVPTTMMLSATRAGVVVISDGLTGDLGFPPTAREWTPNEVVEIRLTRIAGWSARDEATVVSGHTAGIDPNDIDAWVAANDVTIVRDDQMLVGGRTVRVLDVQVDPDTTVRSETCFDDYQPCFLAAAIAGDEGGIRNRAVQVSGAVSQRIFVVPIEGFEPLVIFATAPTGSGWLDILQTDVVGSLTIGPDAAPIGVD